VRAVGETALERYCDDVVEHLGAARCNVGHPKFAHAGCVRKPATSLWSGTYAVHLPDGRYMESFAGTLAYRLS
jgi:hypothetical protein